MKRAVLIRALAASALSFAQEEPVRGGGLLGSRLVTMVLGWLTNLLLVNVLGVSVYVSTVIAAILVIVGNYIISKLLVFRKKKEN